MNNLKNRFVGDLLKPLLLLISFYTFAGSYALRPEIMEDADLWWHLRTGQWIVEHHALPVADPFSQLGAAQPWVVYSWLFEVVLYQLYHWFGLLGITLYTAALTLAIAAALLLLVRCFVADDTQAVFYACIGALAFIPFCNPRPWLFTLLFFILEYALLNAARQTGKKRWLAWLPPIFALWANLHIQFIYGLFLLGFDAVQPWLEQFLRGEFSLTKFRENFQPQRWALLFICTLATLITPYHFKLYQQVFEYAGQRKMYQVVSELQPLSFTSALPWIVLTLTLWAVFRLGWQHLTQPSALVLLLIGVVVAFRSTRDTWFLVVIALTILAATAPLPKRDSVARPGLQFAALLLACGLLFGVAQRRHLNNATLQAAIDQAFPAAAVRIIEERGYTGPLYNHFNWGGYLIWRLPQLPVSMDGRGNLYGEDRIVKHAAIWRGDRRWSQDPELAAAGLVLADVSQTLCELLRHDQRFELVYEDRLAALFKPRPQPLAQRTDQSRQ